MNSDGASIVAAGVVAVSSQLRSKQRYQFSGAGEAVAGEFRDVVVELVLADPVGQPARLRQAVDEALRPGLQHPQRRGLVGRSSASRHQLAQRGRPGRDSVRRRRVPAPGSRGCRRSCRRRPCGTPASSAPAAAAPAERSTPTTPANRSGCSSGAPHATTPPKSWPTMHRAFGADVVEQADDVGGQLDDVVGVDARPASTNRRSRADRAPARGSRPRPAPESGDARSRPVRGSRGPAPPPARRGRRPRSPAAARRWSRLTVRSM